MLALIVSGAYFSFGLYTARQRARAMGLGLRALMASVAAIAVMGALIFLVPSLDMGRGIVLISVRYCVILSVITRFSFARLVDAHLLRRRVLIYGESSRLGVFEKLRRRSDRRGYVLVGIVSPASASDGLGETPSELERLTAPNGLRELCRELDIEEVVVALHDRRGVLPNDELLQCRLAGFSVIDLTTFLERETGRIHIDALSPSWMIFNDGFSRSGIRLFTSRALDFAASALLVALTLPIMGLTALAIWLEDGRQLRQHLLSAGAGRVRG